MAAAAVPSAIAAARAYSLPAASTTKLPAKAENSSVFAVSAQGPCDWVYLV